MTQPDFQDQVARVWGLGWNLKEELRDYARTENMERSEDVGWNGREARGRESNPRLRAGPSDKESGKSCIYKFWSWKLDLLGRRNLA